MFPMSNTVLGRALETAGRKGETNPDRILNGQVMTDLANERRQKWDNFFAKVNY
jgi:hypothetical protein